ncbi:pyroglutamyl-peptidase I [Bacillus luteolus]|uniref:Pyrrolidone-carboxylate peptidase n=1 Tax=Litchfieldia luteola TaxID=682179 RepID=A0ABR9QFL7_9BACI|nr:pyroglutamyl-peptidase I [Cytobacillus luteolus]MBE4907287.1 pyroglutamyl-peptidase I [Cytobacillus luteolus]MBP1943232.1 pyroglutamyl-peptidase [Cytobacillus luteolus]
MKTLLLTGFEPFLGFPINPTEQIVKALDGQTIGGYQIVGKILPVDFAESAVKCLDYFTEVQPDVVISLGLAGGRSKITPERIAINVRDGEADNRGVKLQDSPIEEEGPAGYFSTLPIRRFVDTLQEKGLPANISNSAGTYLCNNVMYSVLHKIEKEGLNGVRAGFIHIPASHELAVKHPKLPSWSGADLEKAVTYMIEVLD